MAQRRATYAENLLSELDSIATAFAAILAASEIKYVNPHRRGSGMFFADAADWGWGVSDDALEVARMELLRRVRDWEPRFRLLFPYPTPKVAERMTDDMEHLQRWLIRDDYWDRSIPSTIDEAQQKLTATMNDIRGLFTMLPSDEYPTRLVVDTNALIDNPDVAAYTDALGDKYVVHLLPVVLGELDELKRAGRNEIVRSGAQRAVQRLKGIRHNGDVLQGVRVQKNVMAKFEHIEPSGTDLPDWLDLNGPMTASSPPPSYSSPDIQAPHCMLQPVT
jgi:hypothetical protein